MRKPGAVSEEILAAMGPGPLAALAPAFVSPWSIIGLVDFHPDDVAPRPPARHCNACPFLERGHA